MSIKYAERKRDVSPLRKYVNELTFRRSSFIVEGAKLLEIGCGNIDILRNLTEEKGGIWVGLDPKNSIATHRETVKNIPFKDNYFDLVVCSQSIEHWYEFITTFDEGLSEIHRVLKLGGLFFIDFPIHLHGHHVFMLGRGNLIYNLFDTSAWAIKKEEKHIPEKPYYTWNGIRRKYADEWLCQKIIKVKRKPAYEVSFLLKKNHPRYNPVHSFFRQKADRCLFKVLGHYKYLRRGIDTVLSGNWKRKKKS